MSVIELSCICGERRIWYFGLEVEENIFHSHRRDFVLLGRVDWDNLEVASFVIPVHYIQLFLFPYLFNYIVRLVADLVSWVQFFPVFAVHHHPDGAVDEDCFFRVPLDLSHIGEVNHSAVRSQMFWLFEVDCGGKLEAVIEMYAAELMVNNAIEIAVVKEVLNFVWCELLGHIEDKEQRNLVDEPTNSEVLVLFDERKHTFHIPALQKYCVVQLLPSFKHKTVVLSLHLSHTISTPMLWWIPVPVCIYEHHPSFVQHFNSLCVAQQSFLYLLQVFIRRFIDEFCA